MKPQMNVYVVFALSESDQNSLLVEQIGNDSVLREGGGGGQRERKWERGKNRDIITMHRDVRLCF